MERPKLNFLTKYGKKYGTSSTANCIPKQTLSFHLRMKQLKLDAPCFWPNFVAKSSFGRSIRRYVPRVWRTDFGFHLVVLRCGGTPPYHANYTVWSSWAKATNLDTGGVSCHSATELIKTIVKLGEPSKRLRNTVPTVYIPLAYHSKGGVHLRNQ